MPVYHYKGYRNDGGAATGIIDAESPKVARVKLRKVGVFPTDMVEQGSATAGSDSRYLLANPLPESVAPLPSARPTWR